MSSKKQTPQRGRETRGKEKSARRSPNLHQPSSSNTVTINDIEEDSASTIQMDTVVKEREMSSSILQPFTFKRNSAILSILRQNENSEYKISDSELDRVQWELESLLSKVLECKNTIRNELNLYGSGQMANSQCQIAKNSKLHMNKAKVAEILSDNECSSDYLTDVEYNSPEKELPPNKTKPFWSVVKPFLAHVSQEDLNWLENLVMSYGSKNKLSQIPPLGEHYSKFRAKVELGMQNQQASTSNQPNMNTKLATQVPTNMVELINRVKNAVRNGNESTPIYQEVTTALLEHSKMFQNNVHDDSDIDDDDDVKYKSDEMETQNIIKLLQTLELSPNYDKSVKSSSSIPDSSSQDIDDNDEILEELTKCDAALSNLQKMNKDHLTKLLEICRKDFCLQKKKKKLQKIDNQILNFKKQRNFSKKKKMKTTKMCKNSEDMRVLLNKRSNYLMRLQSYNVNPTNIDDSESSDE